jgi:galacturan 1,4-alpha-galacturonidase
LLTTLLFSLSYSSTDAETCAAYPSPLLISDIHYDNFFGTSSGKRNATVFDLQCSATCQNITATNIDISPPDAKYGEAEYICKNIEDLSLIELPCNNA